MTDRDPEFDAWIQRARAVPIAEAAERAGAVLKRNGHELTGACPSCGGADRFNVRPATGEWLCRGSAANKGKDGGKNPIDMVKHAANLDFLGACELLTGEAPPKGDGKPINESAARERREERKDREIGDRKKESADGARRAHSAQILFESGRSIFSTDAEAYLRRRGIVLQPDHARDLRFVPGLDYLGYPDRDAKEQTRLGSFPCLLAAVRLGGPDGEIIGCHRTYLSDREPIKLIPPGDRSRNGAKKLYGRVTGGAIWFGPVRPCVAMGEGVETSTSWYQLGYGPEELTVVAGVSLGNISGAAEKGVPHPRKKGPSVPNGIPDPDPNTNQGVILPPEVREVILLGDGDSDAVETRARLMVAMRRYAAQGRIVCRHMAPDGTDWNDVLLADSDHRVAA